MNFSGRCNINGNFNEKVKQKIIQRLLLALKDSVKKGEKRDTIKPININNYVKFM
jgi:hypothetical protein